MQVHRSAEEIRQLGGKVFLLSFSSPAHAELWRRESGVAFPILFDRDRTVYRAYGLERSSLRSLSLRTLAYYARALARGDRIRTGRGDPLQLGGDFIVDASGIVRYAHASRDPVDRPDARTLLETLRDGSRPDANDQKKSVIQGMGPAKSAPRNSEASPPAESWPARVRSDTDA